MQHRIRSKWTAAVLLAGTALAAGCGGPGISPDASPTEVLAAAEAKLVGEDWLDAIELLQGFLRANPGASLVPQAKMRLGDAHFGLEEYPIARSEYEDVVEDYPTSPHVEEARFKIARCAYAGIHGFDRDPTDTEQSITLLESFLREFPTSSFAPEAQAALDDCRGRLARREFETGRFYEGRRRKRSAIIQYEFVVEHYPASTWAREALLRLGEIHASRGERDLAGAAYRRLVELAPQSEEARRAESALAELARGGDAP